MMLVRLERVVRKKAAATRWRETERLRRPRLLRLPGNDWGVGAASTVAVSQTEGWGCGRGGAGLRPLRGCCP